MGHTTRNDFPDHQSEFKNEILYFFEENLKTIIKIILYLFVLRDRLLESQTQVKINLI